MTDDYIEPMNAEDAQHVKENTESNSKCPKKIGRPDFNVIGNIDTKLQFNKMKRKGFIHPTGPTDIFRILPTTSMDYGKFICDPALANSRWQHNAQRFPAPMSPNVYILDTVRRNNKYATFF